MPKRNWEILNKIDEKSEPSVDDIVKVLLESRGYKSSSDQKKFLNPKDPFNISLEEVEIDKLQVDLVLKKLKQIKKNKGQIIVFGDYDVDGVTASAIMWEALHFSGFSVRPYIPNRFTDGYGLSTGTIKKIIKANPDVSLILTVDNGIVSHDAVAFANSKNIDVVITDHHQALKKMPDALAVVHTTQISGSGVSWFLAKEIVKTFGEDNMELSKDHLSLLAMGTIADLIPLVGPNRSLVKFGLEEINKTNRFGLKELIESSSLSDSKIGTYHVGYILSPKINAAGRLEDALDALRMLCTKNPSRAKDLAVKLTDLNFKRQKMVGDIVQKVKSNIDKNGTKPIVVYDQDLHEGIIGLIASKLTEAFYRPAIVISVGKETSKASARSIDGFNIIENIRKVDSLLLESGGHPMAAGFSIINDNIEKFVDEFEKVSSPLLNSEVLTKSLKIDAQMNFKPVNEELVEKISLMEPFGNKNPKPLFSANDVIIKSPTVVGRDKTHLKFTAVKDGLQISAIAFNFAQFNADKADIVYEPSINEWNGKRNMDLKIKDMKTHEQI